jgi:hypothetical protein
MNNHHIVKIALQDDKTLPIIVAGTALLNLLLCYTKYVAYSLYLICTSQRYGEMFRDLELTYTLLMTSLSIQTLVYKIETNFIDVFFSVDILFRHSTSLWCSTQS